MGESIDGNDIAHIRLPQEVRLKNLLNQRELDLYNDFCQSIENQTDSLDALNDIYLRLKRLLGRSDLTPYVATIDQKDIPVKAINTISMMQRFFKNYELFADKKDWNHISARQVFSDTVDCIHKLNSLASSTNEIQHYLEKEMKSVVPDGNIYTLLLDAENLIVFAKHFFDTYAKSTVSSTISHIYNQEKRYLLEWAGRGENESGPETAKKWAILNDILQDDFMDTEGENIRSKEDMLLRLFFMYRYEKIINSLITLEDHLTDLREFEHTKNDLFASKKKYKEVIENYTTAKSDFQEIHILLKEIHKESPSYNQNIEDAINNLYRTLCEEIEYILGRMFARIVINYN